MRPIRVALAAAAVTALSIPLPSAPAHAADNDVACLWTGARVQTSAPLYDPPGPSRTVTFTATYFSPLIACFGAGVISGYCTAATVSGRRVTLIPDSGTCAFGDTRFTVAAGA